MMRSAAVPAASRVNTQAGTGRAMMASPRNFSRWASIASCRKSWRGMREGIVIQAHALGFVVRCEAARSRRHASRKRASVCYHQTMRYDVIAIVASARGVSPMRRLLKRLPENFPTPVVCLAECHETLAPQLAAETGLDVRSAEAGEKVQPGRVYLSPPGRTPILGDDRAILLAPYGPESVALHPQDHFLASIAAQYGARALCVVLGNFDGDGVKGAQAVKERGGTVLVLDRQTAEHWGMAEPIIRAGAADRVLSAEEVAEALRAWFSPCDILESA